MADNLSSAELLASLNKESSHFNEQEQLNVVQIPHSLQIDDLPAEIKLGSPFRVGGEMYILRESGECGFVFCKEDGEQTTETKKCKKYYTISKVYID